MLEQKYYLFHLILFVMIVKATLIMLKGDLLLLTGKPKLPRLEVINTESFFLNLFFVKRKIHQSFLF